MRTPIQGTCAVLWALAGPATAASGAIPADFRAAFESRVRRGAFAVVARPGIPTVPVHGLDGQQQDAYYSVDVKRGEWKPSQGFLDLNQVAVDELAAGEVMEIVGVTYKDKDNRVDVRLVSREAHDVTRAGSGATREPVGTNFKFFFPFPLHSALAAPAAVGYVEAYLRVFPREDEARAWASLLGGRGGAGGPARGSGRVTEGMTPLEVLDVLGKPDRELSSGSQSKWTYRDVVVVFENGRVKTIEF